VSEEKGSGQDAPASRAVEGRAKEEEEGLEALEWAVRDRPGDGAA